MKKRILLSTAAIVFAVSACAGKEARVEWSEVPAVVQRTITHHAEGGEIEEVEKEIKLKNGNTVTIYEAEVKRPDGKKIEIKVGEDGKLIELEED